MSYSLLSDFVEMEIDWFYFTKEKLSSEQIFTGLLDYGLFAEKVPPCFTSVGLAEFAKKSKDGILDDCDEQKLRSNIDKCSHDYIRYEALRDINIPRHLGIPHPEAYAIQALSISKHWQEIATHCDKPQPQISRIHVRHIGDGRIFEMNYKGSEKYQFEELEIEWMIGAQYVVEADIASCFPSIYTHSIPWALNGKSKAKKSNNLSTLSGNLLDKCTQNTRDRQTNGLLIGPHASNVISEIILTSIDTSLQAKGYKKIFRYIDDYTFYASTHEEAERFIKDLGILLRHYEMSLNDKKTKILPLPKPTQENWIRSLNRFAFPKDEEIRYSLIRSFLDLALECSQTIGKSTPLNYAIKILKGKEQPRNLNLRAKQLYTQEAINLALAYPYLAPVLDKSVFDRYWHEGLKEKILDFSINLIRLGLRKLYPDAIAHALYYTLKHDLKLSDLKDNELIEAVALDDSITNVLLYEYALRHSKSKLKSSIKARSDEIKKSDPRDKDKNWLLIYQTWSAKDLTGNGQSFLGELKKANFSFIRFSKSSDQKTPQSIQPAQPVVNI